VLKNILISFKILILFTVILGVIYPLFITGISRLIFNKQANGSLITHNGITIGSELIGQNFEKDKYFHGRPSATGYNTIPSGATNLSYTSFDLKKQIAGRKKILFNENIIDTPKDLLFASASGLDPHISPEAAIFQVERIAKERKFGDTQVKELLKLINKSVEKRQFGFLGEDRINVLLLNIKLDEIR
jgi:potassium-transporting ATPase KdpC subunit